MYPRIRKLANMTTNKQFNTYKEGLDLEFLRGETLEDAGEPHSG